MKVHRMFTLEAEQAKFLQEHENGSGLIRSLLDEYMRKNDSKKMTKEELRRAIAIAKAKKEYDLKLEALNG